MRRHHSIRARWRFLRVHHHAALAHVGRTGIYGELAYHAAELGGFHSALVAAAAVLLIATIASLIQGGH